MIVAAVVLGTLAYLAAGVSAGRKAAPIAYRRYRVTWVYSEAREPADKGQGSAAAAFVLCLLAGPLGWVYVAAHRTAERVVPELRAAKAARTEKAHKAEIEAMQRQIDEAHKALGIAPLNRNSA